MLISSQQTAYVANRCIRESGRQIFDVLVVSEKFKTKNYLVKIGRKKSFVSLNHIFLLTTLEKFGFETNFIDWMKSF